MMDKGAGLDVGPVPSRRLTPKLSRRYRFPTGLGGGQDEPSSRTWHGSDSDDFSTPLQFSLSRLQPDEIRSALSAPSFR